MARLIAVVLVTAGVAAGGGYAWWTGALGALPVPEHCTATATGSTAELEPEQAGNAATIAALAVQRGLPGRAATIGIATAMQESKLINLPNGDRDSLGLFQQRPSQGWGTPSQVLDPVYATNAFYDVLVKVEGYQNLPVTTAAQRVQRSAFPSAYADHEKEARLWASTLTGYSPAGLTCVLRAAEPGSTAVDEAGFTARAKALAAAARAETGRTGTTTGDPSGRIVTFTVTGSDSRHARWALAQWAVARAAGLGVDEVAVDGQRWTRQGGARGWVTDNGANGVTVQITVAA